MTGHGFTSAFAARLDEYLEFKCSMGFYGASRIWYLKRFDAYCAEHGRSVLRPGHRRGMGDGAAFHIGPLPVVDVVYP